MAVWIRLQSETWITARPPLGQCAVPTVTDSLAKSLLYCNFHPKRDMQLDNICDGCGADVEQGSKYCSNCGSSTVSAAEADSRKRKDNPFQKLRQFLYALRWPSPSRIWQCVPWQGWILTLLTAYIFLIVGVSPFTTVIIGALLWACYVIAEENGAPVPKRFLNRSYHSVRSWSSLALSVAFFTVFSGIWIIDSYPKKALKYLENSPPTVPILGALEFVQFRDLAGYSGQLGGDGAKEEAIAAGRREVQAWNEMDGFGTSLLNGTLLGKCAAEVHDSKINFFLGAAMLAEERLIANNKVQSLFGLEKRVASQSSDCHRLASAAAEKTVIRTLAHSMWAKITGYAGDDEDFRRYAKERLFRKINPFAPSGNLSDFINAHGFPAIEKVQQDYATQTVLNAEFEKRMAFCREYCNADEQRMLALEWARRLGSPPILFTAAASELKFQSYAASSSFALRGLLQSINTNALFDQTSVYSILEEAHGKLKLEDQEAALRIAKMGQEINLATLPNRFLPFFGASSVLAVAPLVSAESSLSTLPDALPRSLRKHGEFYERKLTEEKNLPDFLAKCPGIGGASGGSRFYRVEVEGAGESWIREDFNLGTHGDNRSFYFMRELGKGCEFGGELIGDADMAHGEASGSYSEVIPVFYGDKLRYMMIEEKYFPSANDLGQRRDKHVYYRKLVSVAEGRLIKIGEKRLEVGKEVSIDDIMPFSSFFNRSL